MLVLFLEKQELEQKALLGDEEPRRQKLLQPHAARLAERRACLESQ